MEPDYKKYMQYMYLFDQAWQAPSKYLLRKYSCHNLGLRINHQRREKFAWVLVPGLEPGTFRM